MVTKRQPARGETLLLVGTMKGAFFLERRGAAWKVRGPYFPGQPVYALAHDDRLGRSRVYAGTESPFWGPTLHVSDDLGATWTQPRQPNVRFPKPSGLCVKQIWQIAPGPRSEPDTVYVGVAPAALFKSTDGGRRFSLVRGLFNHPHRPQWSPGAGGLCLHTILQHPKDPERMLVAISTGGIYLTQNGGRTWRASNTGIRAQFLPNKYPEFGQCVHKVVRHPARPERYFLQNHWGLYRSDDDGGSWHDIASGVPSDFGFGMAIHPHDPDTVYIVPLESDQFRCTPGARLRVYRTQDAGRRWRPLSKGLPQKDAWETVLRDCLTTDDASPAGVYFGTRSGKVYASRDAGGSWRCIAEGLPPVTCVKTGRLRRRRARRAA